MTRSLGWTWVALGLLAGCSGGGTAPAYPDGGSGCLPCSAGKGCDAATRTCVPGASAGELCGSSVVDGGPTSCVDGTECGPVATGDNVCAVPCTTSASCSSGQACFSNPAGLPARDYCAAEVAIGQPCGLDRLLECVGSNGAVVQCIESGGSGVCYARCLASSDCPTGQACTVPFSDGKGVCVTPTSEGSPCTQSNPADYQLCSAPQLCVVESASGAGVCHVACAVDGGGCPTGESCSYPNPCSDADGFCVAPVAQGASCTLDADHFCGPSDDCVNLASGFTCEADCSTGQSCGTGTSCQPLPAVTDGGGTCRRACF